MSQENVDVVEQALDAYRRRDIEAAITVMGAERARLDMSLFASF
jgi:hypothetical protein